MEWIETWPGWLPCYLVWNVVALLLMGWDKRQAKLHQWRVPERTLFLVALGFGAVGILTGMFSFHHKTRHWRFLLAIPCLVAVNGACLYLLRLALWERVAGQ